MDTVTPKTITREQYVQLIEALGFDPHHLRKLVFTPEHVMATVVTGSGELSEEFVKIRIIDK